MHIILYLEVQEYINYGNRSSYDLLYYMLDYSSNYLTVVDGEKNLGKLKGVSKTAVANKIADLINLTGEGSERLIILTDSYYKSIVTKFVESCKAYLYISRDMPFVIETVGEYLSYTNLSLYNLYTLNFGTPMLSMSKLDMIDKLLVSNLFKEDEVDYAFLFIKTIRRSDIITLTVCWCTLSIRYEVQILGSHECFMSIDIEDAYSLLNNFITEVKLRVVNSGLAFDSLIPVFYSEYDYKQFTRWTGQFGAQLISNKSIIFFYESLRASSNLGLFTPDINLKSYDVFMRLYTSTLKSDYLVTANELALIFKNMAHELQLHYRKGSNYLTHNSDRLFRKDFSGDIVNIDIKTGYKLAILLDCEGTPTGGCREVGGLIVAQGNNMIIKLETFYFKQRDFTEGLTNMINRFEKLLGRYLPAKGIPVYTYGGTDRSMIEQELNESSSRNLRRRFKSQFEFINIQNYIFSYLAKINLILENRKLTDIAQALGVQVITPVHNALNDAKTLFNILARICLSGMEV